MAAVEELKPEIFLLKSNPVWKTSFPSEIKGRQTSTRVKIQFPSIINSYSNFRIKFQQRLIGIRRPQNRH